MESSGFSKCSIILSENKDNLTSFPIYIPFISSSLIHLAKISSIILNRSDGSGHPYLFLIVEEIFSIFPIQYDIGYDFLFIVIIVSRYISLILNCSGLLSWMDAEIFKDFFGFTLDGHVIFVPFCPFFYLCDTLHSVIYIYWAILQSCNEANLIIVYGLLMHSWIWFASILLRIFYILCFSWT